MENNPEEDKPIEEEGATPAGMVEAVTQDVELIVDKVMDSAGNAVVVVEETLGIRPAPVKRAKPKAKAPKAKAKAAKARGKKAAKAAKAKPSKVAKSARAKARPSKRPKAAKGKAAKRRR